MDKILQQIEIEMHELLANYWLVRLPSYKSILSNNKISFAILNSIMSGEVS